MDHSQPHNGTAVFSLTDVVLPTVKSFQADLSSQRFRNGFVEVPGFPVNRGQAALLCLCILMWIHTCLPSSQMGAHGQANVFSCPLATSPGTGTGRL